MLVAMVVHPPLPSRLYPALRQLTRLSRRSWDIAALLRSRSLSQIVSVSTLPVYV